jgi:hypothetical protein
MAPRHRVGGRTRLSCAKGPECKTPRLWAGAFCFSGVPDDDLLSHG